MFFFLAQREIVLKRISDLGVMCGYFFFNSFEVGIDHMGTAAGGIGFRLSRIIITYAN